MQGEFSCGKICLWIASPKTFFQRIEIETGHAGLRDSIGIKVYGLYVVDLVSIPGTTLNMPDTVHEDC